ncbi:MAG TPA: bifunctional adenosylcobinamide kinase/adenosylcobinamide-phosphate guanylyltransferase [Candidatus Binataceae bacterium]|nr:bifunctional adenosylcobinamide kinase/adenosylcobinamide-phosphate guanylyltransferase [Candidatus Binataceae bacterium]
MDYPHLVLVTGGSRSGKSAHALELAAQAADRKRAPAFFIATAQALDEEMAARIARHRAARPARFRTIEEPVALIEALGGVEDNPGSVVVIDCLTLWLSNLIARALSDEAVVSQAEALARTLTLARYSSVVVSGEVGSGLVPIEPLGRRFRDLLGWTNQLVARAADRVILMVAGCPLVIK